MKRSWPDEWSGVFRSLPAKRASSRQTLYWYRRERSDLSLPAHNSPLCAIFGKRSLCVFPLDMDRRGRYPAKAAVIRQNALPSEAGLAGMLRRDSPAPCSRMAPGNMGAFSARAAQGPEFHTQEIGAWVRAADKMALRAASLGRNPKEMPRFFPRHFLWLFPALSMAGILPSADHAAADFGSRVPGRLRMVVIRTAVNHNRFPQDIPHAETICPHGQIRVSMARHQQRKVSCMVRMLFPCWIIVASRLRKALSKAGVPLVDVQGKKTGLTVARKSGKLGYYQNPPAFLIKPDLPG